MRSFSVSLGGSSMDYSIKMFSTPISYNFISGKKNHHFESGLQFNPTYYHFGGSLPHILYLYFEIGPSIGYRYQRPIGGLILRFNCNGMFPIAEVVGAHIRQLQFNNPFFRNHPYSRLETRFMIGIGYTFRQKKK